MARKAKTPTPAVTTELDIVETPVVLAEPAAPAATPFAGLVAAVTAEPAAAALTARQAMLAKAAAFNMQALVNGAQVAAAANVAARSASLNKPLAVQVAATSYTIARVPRLGVPYTQANWPAIEQAMEAEDKATGAQLQAAGATADFIKYAIKNGWLAAA